MISEDPRGYGLVNFAEPDYDNNTNHQPFQLKKWIYRDHPSRYLDKYDPYAGDIDYPPYMIDNSIIEQFTLASDTENRYWYLNDSDSASIVTQIWSEDKPERRDDYIRRGHRMHASLSFLLDLSLKTESDLIFEVQINRRLTRSYHRKEEDDFGYPPPYRKIYILSKNGRFRDTRKSIRLREKVS